MSSWKTPEIRQAFMSQRAVLWLGPAYGWEEERETPRSLNALDEALAKVPWKSVFSESPVPNLEQEISNVEHGTSRETSHVRRPHPLSKPDPDREIITSDFLPIYYLNGRLRASNREDRYKALPAQLRKAYRGGMLLSLRPLAQEEGVIVLYGFEPSTIGEYKEEARAVVGQTVPILILSQAQDTDFTESDDNCHIIESDVVEFVTELKARGWLAYAEDRQASVWVGSSRVRIDDILQGPLGRLDDAFRVVTAEAVEKPSALEKNVFQSFMVLNETRDAPNVYEDRKEWAGFASGLFLDREYTGGRGLPLDLYVLHKLQALSEMGPSQSDNLTLNLPVDSGSGTTTLLHKTAFTCAREGFPTFLLKQDTQDIAVGQIINVLTDLLRRARQTANPDGRGKNLASSGQAPFLFVFDVDHSQIDEVLFLAERLRTAGRQCIVLRACEVGGAENDAEDETLLDVKQVQGNSEELPRLKAEISEKELTRTCEHFEWLRESYGLPLVDRTLSDWKDFQRQSSFTILSQQTEEAAENLFWVALHYFVTSSDDSWQTHGVGESLGERLSTLASRDPECAKLLLDIARFSINGLYVSWRFLGRLEGDSFSTDVLDRAKMLEKEHLVRFRWEAERGSNLYRLRHRLYARIFLAEACERRETLRRKGVPDEALPAVRKDLSHPVWLLVPYLGHLDGSVPGDVRLAESVSERALRIESTRRKIWRDREDILAAFESVPRVIRSSSRAINHHHAMALWKTAKYDTQLDSCEEEKRYKQAVSLLDRALDIPQRSHERDEHPGHILTTKGYALWYWSQSGTVIDGSKELESIDTFREALKEIRDNRYAVYGLARALVVFCERKASSGSSAYNASLISEALDLLQDEPTNSFATNWYHYQERAINLIDSSASPGFRKQLREKNEEAGYLLEAWALLGASLDDASPEEKEDAYQLLREAIDHPDVECTWRIFLLSYRLCLNRSDDRENMSRRYELLRALQQKEEFFMRPEQMFDLAFLCYQLGKVREGSEIFRRMRMTGAYRSIDLPAHRFWTEPEPPFSLRSATLEVKRTESAYKGWGYVRELDEEIPFSPAHFESGREIQSGTVMRCCIRFSGSGPKAVPERFYDRKRS